MDMKAIRSTAKSIGVKPGKLSKTELIRQIQIAEGNFDCYATATSGDCDQADCAWRGDCLSAAADASPQPQ